MKKILVLTICLLVALCAVSCALLPADQNTEPAETVFSYIPIPEDLPASGLCAVGVVDPTAKIAKIVTDTGIVAEIPYRSGTHVIAGEIYRFTRSEHVVVLAQIQFHNTSAPWNPRMYDHTEEGLPDRILFHNGKRALVYELTEDCVVFVRYSDTEYRVFSGSDVIKQEGWPCWLYFNAISLAPEELSEESDLVGYTSVILVVGDPESDQRHADAATSFFFDPEGMGWDTGDLIIQ